MSDLYYYSIAQVRDCDVVDWTEFMSSIKYTTDTFKEIIAQARAVSDTEHKAAGNCICISWDYDDLLSIDAFTETLDAYGIRPVTFQAVCVINDGDV